MTSAVEIERHTEAGYRLLTGSGNDLLELAATIARSHHERWDGSGYPYGLAGEEIPLEGRIVAVADVFDALTSDRPYRPELTPDEAREHIAAEAGTAFDPRVVAAFLELRALGWIGVRASSPSAPGPRRAAALVDDVAVDDAVVRDARRRPRRCAARAGSSARSAPRS